MTRGTRIITINVQGLRGSESRTLLFQWALYFEFDILCVQETHATSIQEFSSRVEDYNARALPHKKLCCESSPGSACSCGVAILYRPAFQVLNVRRDDSGHLVVDFSCNNFDFQVMCLYRSDHQCIYLDINFPWGVERGPGRWKFNVSLLQNEAFCTGVNDFGGHWRLERRRFSLLSNWYEAGKVRLCRFIIDFSRNLARENKSKFTELNSRLAALERRVHRGENLCALLEEARAELDEYLSHQAQGAMLRAPVREAAEGERSKAYFLRQERVRGQQKLINAIRQSDGTVVSSTNDILGVWRNFYFRLFLSQELSKVNQRPFLDSIEGRLTSNKSKLCEGDLTIEECSKALSKMPSAKSPGVDGLPAEFYRRGPSHSCVWTTKSSLRP